MRRKNPQEDFILANIGKMPRTKLMREAHISTNAFYTILRRNRIPVKHIAPRPPQPAKVVVVPDIAYQIAEMYKTHSVSEIIHALGIKKCQGRKWIKHLHAEHTPEGWKRIRNKCIASSLSARTPESFAKGAATAKRNREKDRIRLMAGLPQETRYILTREPKRVYCARARAVRQWNYFLDPDNKKILYWDHETRRIPNEQQWAERYGFQILQADEEEEHQQETNQQAI